MATALIAIGFASIIAQILVLRELVFLFNGNELTYGTSLMIWLVSGGLGSYLAGKIAHKINKPLKAVSIIELAISMIIPAEILFARLSKPLFNVPTGAIPDLLTILIISLLAIAPASFLLASLFTIGSASLKDIGRMYIIESLGAVLGGMVFSFILIYFMDPFQISGVVGILLACSALYLYKHYVRTKDSNKIGNILILSLVLTLNAVLVFPLGHKLDQFSAKAQFPGLNLARSADSVYGRISVIEDKGAYSYFESGSLMFSTATVAENEELVHLSFLEANSPRTVLLIGGGLGGVIQEIFKYNNLRKLDYVEFDPKLADLSIYKFPSIVTDGRYFIRRTPQKYDLIIVNVGDPSNAALNRFYTYEFMMSCRDKLSRGGVLAMRISASDSYMRKELRGLNSSIFKTLNLAFPRSIVVPGSSNYFFASDKTGVLTTSPAELINRWRGYRIPTKYFNEMAIPHILEPGRLKYMGSAIKYDERTRINRDLTPVSYLYSILTWLSYFPSVLSMQLQKLFGITFNSLIFWLFAAAFIFKAASTRYERIGNLTLPAIIGLTGSCAMTLQLLAIYSFQALYGYIYFKIGLLMAVFMGGLAIGGYLTNTKYQNARGDRVIALLLVSIFGFVFYIISTPKLPYQLSEYLIPVFSFMFALLVGAVFPLAVKMYQAKSLESKAGILYGSDLLGGAAAALFTSIWFIPAYGIIGTCLIALALSVISLILIPRGTHLR